MADIHETLLHAPHLSLSVALRTVRIEISCGDLYTAQILFDDLSERLSAGQTIAITPTPPDRSAPSRPPAKP